MFSFLKEGGRQRKVASDPPLYTPLTEPSNIRLFRIKPCPDGVSLDLEMFEAPPNHPYKALSYVWGDPKDTKAILVNDHLVNATRNLYNFLKQLSFPTYVAGPFWADAICINQSDNEEKDRQVSMMDKIYSRATRAIVWLGEEDYDSHLAFDLIRKISERSRNVYMQMQTLKTTQSQAGTTTGYLAEIGAAISNSEHVAQLMHSTFTLACVSPETSAPTGWKAAYRLWARPWFTRIWTVQEFILPKEIDFVCGKLSVDANTFSLCGDMVLNAIARSYPPPAFEQLPPDVFWSVIYGLQSCLARRQYQSGTEIFSEHLLETVNRYRERQATDPRDKIFAVFSIADNTAFRVDYTKSTKEVYHQFAVQCTLDGLLSTMLQYTWQPKAISNIPTWVPDWTARKSRNSPVAPSFYRGAGGQELYRNHFSADQLSLFVQVILLGPIIEICHVSNNRMTPVNVLEELVMDQPGLEIVRPETQSPAEALYRTFAGDVMAVNTAAQRIPDSISVSSYASNKNAVGSITIPQTGEMPFQRIVQDLTSNNVLFATNNGYIGLAPEATTRLNDVVALIRGVQMPAILRPKDNYFEFVDGFSYVHAVMDGEALSDVASGKLAWQAIELR